MQIELDYYEGKRSRYDRFNQNETPQNTIEQGLFF